MVKAAGGRGGCIMAKDKSFRRQKMIAFVRYRLIHVCTCVCVYVRACVCLERYFWDIWSWVASLHPLFSVWRGSNTEGPL